MVSLKVLFRGRANPWCPAARHVGRTKPWIASHVDLAGDFMRPRYVLRHPEMAFASVLSSDDLGWMLNRLSISGFDALLLFPRLGLRIESRPCD